MGKEKEESHEKEGSTSENEKVEVTYKFPKYVGFILGNEFCERYSFYGLRTILVIYLTYFIGYDEDLSTAIYHGFSVLAYLTPLFGAALADGYWGKYKVILWVSLLYCVGMIINAASTLPFLSSEEDEIRVANAILNMIGLIVIGLGTGGIKPCVSSFGGDQFHPKDTKNTGLFFDLFYWSINAGSLISTFLSPLLRGMTCGALGTSDSCFFLAFGIPVILMFVAVLAFLFGTKYYKRVPPSGFNIFWEVIKCIFLGWFRKVTAEAKEKG